MAIRAVIFLAIIISLSGYLNYRSRETIRTQIKSIQRKETLDNYKTKDMASKRHRVSVIHESLSVTHRKQKMGDADLESTKKQMTKDTLPEEISGYHIKKGGIRKRSYWENLNEGTSIVTGNQQKTKNVSLYLGHRKRVKREKEKTQNGCPERKTEFERKCIDILSCCYNKDLNFPNCYCDEMCTVFQDCCPDFNKTSDYVFSGRYEKIILQSECKIIAKTYRRAYRLVTNCPKNYMDLNISRKCQEEELYVSNYLQILPVTDHYHVTYRNIYCALCNEVYDVNVWNMGIRYLSFKNMFNTSKIIDFFMPKKFDIILNDLLMFPPNGVYPRICNEYLYGYTKETGQLLPRDKHELKCTTIQQALQEILPYYSDNLCFTAAWEFNYCTTRQNHTSCTKCISVDVSEESTRFSFFEMYAILTNVMGHNECDQNLRRITTKAKENFCVSSTLSVVNPEYNLYTYFQIKGMPSLHTIDLLHTIIFIYIKAIFQVEVHLRFNKFLVYEPADCNIFYWEMTLLYVMETDENYFIKLSQWFEQFVWSFTLENDNGTVNMFKLSTNDIQNDTICNFNQSISWYNAMFIKKHAAIYGNFPRTQRLCQNVSFTLPSYEPESPVKQMMNQVRVFESDCRSITMGNYNHDFYDMILTTATYTLMGTGCVALIGSIATHVYLNTEVSIPSHITKHMMVSTLLFQILYIVGIGANDDKHLCFSLGVILHYLLLCVFSWKSICVGYLAHNLRQIRKFPAYAHLDKKKTRYTITCFGYTLPLLIVGPSVFIDKCRCTSFSIDYGNGICFPNPNSYPESVFVVTGPISVHIFFNIICLIVSVYELSITKINVGLLGVSRTYTPIYLKLCVFSGIAWIFGIITLVMPLPIIRALFILTCCSQGLFLSVITVCNVRVWKSLKTQVFSSGD